MVVMPSEEYLIEWVHRLVAATTGVLIIATMIASLINKNSDLKIKITSSIATASSHYTDYSWCFGN